MRQTKSEKKFLIIGFVAVIISCNHGLVSIGNSNVKHWSRKDDSIPKIDTLTFIYDQQDSMVGIYSFIILAGYVGRTLRIRKDLTYIEMAWSDVGKSSTIKGNWNLSNGKVILKHGRKRASFKIHQYSWATFLVPENKTEVFAYEFNKNKLLIDSLKNQINQMDHNQIHRRLYEFRTICLLRDVKR